jgi:hypothetical protein
MADSPHLDAWAAYARIAELPYDRARLEVLAPEVEALAARTRRTWTVDVSGHEMALGFRVEERAHDAGR